MIWSVGSGGVTATFVSPKRYGVFQNYYTGYIKGLWKSRNRGGGWTPFFVHFFTPIYFLQIIHILWGKNFFHLLTEISLDMPIILLSFPKSVYKANSEAKPFFLNHSLKRFWWDRWIKTNTHFSSSHQTSPLKSLKIMKQLKKII